MTTCARSSVLKGSLVQNRPSLVVQTFVLKKSGMRRLALRGRYGGRTSLSKHTQSPPSPQVGSLHNAQHPPTYLCVVLSGFVPNVCQLMLNTGTPSVDIGEGQTYNRWQTKKCLCLVHPHTHYRRVQIWQLPMSRYWSRTGVLSLRHTHTYKSQHQGCGHPCHLLVS